MLKSTLLLQHKTSLVGKQSGEISISEKSAPKASVKKESWKERDQEELKVGFTVKKAGKDLVMSEGMSANTEGEILNRWKAEP